MKNIYLATKPGICKAATVVIMIIVTAVGITAYNDSIVKTLMDNRFGYEACKMESNCPHEVKELEGAFVWTTIIVLALSIINLIVFFFLKTKPAFNTIDIIFNTVAGILTLAVGLIFIYCAVRMDLYVDDPPLPSNIKTEVRKEMKFINKLAAGSLEIIAAILFFVTVSAIRKFGNVSPSTQTVFVQQQQQYVPPPPPPQQYQAGGQQYPQQNRFQPPQQQQQPQQFEKQPAAYPGYNQPQSYYQQQQQPPVYTGYNNAAFRDDQQPYQDGRQDYYMPPLKTNDAPGGYSGSSNIPRARNY